MRITVTLHFAKGYIANPYWPTMDRIITIRKQSGVDRARSEEKRTKTLKAWLKTHEMTLDDYRALELDAARPFYTHADGEIVIPAHHLHGFMGNVAALAPASVRLAKTERVRTLVEWEDLVTGKRKPDGRWERFVRNPLTNQRRLQSSEYISEFEATGVLRLSSAAIEKKTRECLAWGGEEVGIGAARKMGWGRFTITGWVPEWVAA